MEKTMEVRLAVCTFLYSFDFQIINICSQISKTKAEKMLCRDLNGKEIQKRGDYMYMYS